MLHSTDECVLCCRCTAAKQQHKTHSSVECNIKQTIMILGGIYSDIDFIIQETFIALRLGLWNECLNRVGNAVSPLSPSPLLCHSVRRCVLRSPGPSGLPVARRAGGAGNIAGLSTSSSARPQSSVPSTESRSPSARPPASLTPRNTGDQVSVLWPPEMGGPK